jgi:hypothetical protein
MGKNEKGQLDKGGNMRIQIIIAFFLTICLTFLINTPTVFGQDDFTIFKKVDKGKQSLYMELLIKSPTKDKIETSIKKLVERYGDRKWLQIDIFDNLEALQRRGDEKYPTKLVNKHWLVSITNEKVHRFYLTERPEIK